jgi:glycerophosphoryl diester phosphodiesterase
MSYRRATIAFAVVASTGLLFVPATANAAHQVSKSTPCSKALISAHLGYRLNADADTVESQQAAFDIGTNIADSDLWVTKDGYIVEIHDNDVSLWTDGHGLITDMTLDQVEQLRTVPHNELIPQLSDSLSLPAGQQAGRYFMFEAEEDVFDDNPVNQQKLVDAVESAGMTGHVIIYTSGWKLSHDLKTLDPNLMVWVKGGPDANPPLSVVQGLNGVMISAHLLTPAVVQEFHSVGAQVIRERAGAESKTTWKNFVRNGADGLMTDDPVFMIKQCRRSA